MYTSHLTDPQVTNQGEVAGDEITQLYIRDLLASVTRPVRELKAFQRVFLKPGETKTIRFTFHSEDLMFAGLEERMINEPGDYQVWVGPNSAEGLQGTFTLKE